MTKRVEKLFDLRINFLEFDLKTPDYFHVSTDVSRDIILHVNKEKQSMSTYDYKKPKKPITIVSSETTDSSKTSEPRILKTVEDISKSLLQITTPNFKEVQKKELFKAPSREYSTTNATTIGNSQLSEDEKENVSKDKLTAPKQQAYTEGNIASIKISENTQQAQG